LESQLILNELYSLCMIAYSDMINGVIPFRSEPVDFKPAWLNELEVKS
jgi:hypothetical protein